VGEAGFVGTRIREIKKISVDFKDPVRKYDSLDCSAFELTFAETLMPAVDQNCLVAANPLSDENANLSERQTKDFLD
jgi:hypothetical protein